MTNNQIIFEAKRLVDRIKLEYPDFFGKTANLNDIKKKERKLNINLPDWFIVTVK
jgi:hypothetical protein